MLNTPIQAMKTAHDEDQLVKRRMNNSYSQMNVLRAADDKKGLATIEQ